MNINIRKAFSRFMSSERLLESLVFGSYPVGSLICWVHPGRGGRQTGDVLRHDRDRGRILVRNRATRNEVWLSVLTIAEYA